MFDFWNLFFGLLNGFFCYRYWGKGGNFGDNVVFKLGLFFN